MSHAQLTGDWPRLRYIINDFSPKLRIAIRAAARRNAILVLREIKKGIREQSPGGQDFAPLHDLTIEEKRSKAGIGATKSRQALIRHGDLINSFTFEVDELQGSFWVGIKDGTTNSEGVDLNMIARIMELGVTLNVTERMRAYFASQGRPLKKETTHLEVPARPFLEPVFNKLKPVILNNYIDAIDRVLAGKPSLGSVIKDE